MFFVSFCLAPEIISWTNSFLRTTSTSIATLQSWCESVKCFKELLDLETFKQNLKRGKSEYEHRIMRIHEVILVTAQRQLPERLVNRKLGRYVKSEW